MAETKVITLDLKTNLEQSTKAVGSLKSQLKEAQAEVAALSDKFGATSQQAIEAAKRAAELKDKLGDAKALTDAFNPDAKFKALTGSLSGAAAGLSVVAGTMGMLGAESDKVQGLILKVQSAMAISSGLQQIGESVDTFKQLGAVIKSTTIFQKIATAAQWLWNAAMDANPLGAIVLAITALIAAGYALIKFFSDSAEEEENAIAASKKHTKEIEAQTKANDDASESLKIKNSHEYNMAKASGASTEALRKLALSHAQTDQALRQHNFTLAQNVMLQKKSELAALSAAGASDEVIAAKLEETAAAVKANNDAAKAYDDASKNTAAVRNKNAEEERAEQTEKNKKLREDAQKHNDELLEKQKEAGRNSKAERKRIAAEAEKEEENRIKSVKDLEKNYLNDLLNLNAKTEEEKLDLQAQRDLEEINRIAKTANEKSNLMALYNEKYNTLYQELDDKNKAEQLEKDNEARETKLANQSKLDLDLAKNADLSFQVRLQAIIDREALEKDIIFKSQEDKTAFEKENADARIAIAKEEQNAKLEQAERGAALLENISGLLGKQTAAGKAAAVAATIINTYASAQKAFTNAQENPISIIGPAYPYIQAGFAVAAGLKNVQSILAVPTPNGGGGGSAPKGAGTSAAPSFNVVGNSGTNQIAQVMNKQGMPPVQAYVVASNVTTAQSLNRNIVSNATLG